MRIGHGGAYIEDEDMNSNRAAESINGSIELTDTGELERYHQLEMKYLKAQMLILERERIIRQVTKAIDDYVNSDSPLAFNHIWDMIRPMIEMRTNISETVKEDLLDIGVGSIEKRLQSIH